jgi:hypothetical protein
MRFFREYLLQLVVGVGVTATITAFAVIGKYWNWPNALVGSLLSLCGIRYLPTNSALVVLRNPVLRWFLPDQDDE